MSQLRLPQLCTAMLSCDSMLPAEGRTRGWGGMGDTSVKVLSGRLLERNISEEGEPVPWGKGVVCTVAQEGLN